MMRQNALAVAVLAAALLFTPAPAALAGGETPGATASPAVETAAAPEGTPAPPADEIPAPADGRAHSLRELLGGDGPGSRIQRSAGTWVLTGNTELIGPTCLEAGAALNLKGYSLTVYGDVSIGGTLTLGSGKLIVKGNLIVEGGLLVMTNATDTVEVSKALIMNAADETGKLVSGKLKVLGDFVQQDTYSPRSYNESGSHTTTLGGAGKLVMFESPVGSGIRNPVFLSGTTFSSAGRTLSYRYTYMDSTGSIQGEDRTCEIDGTFLSLTSTLTSNYTIAVPNLYFMGSQGSWNLTVSGGNLIVPEGAERSLTGNVSAGGIAVAGTLTMPAPGKTAAASGRFAVTGTLNLNAGAVSAAVFDAYGAVNRTGGTLTVTDRYCRHAASEEDSLLARTTGGALTVSKDSTAEFAASAAALQLSGSLGGRKVSFTGALTIPAGASLDMDGGRLDVSGGMTATGRLNMAAHTEVVTVGGRFTANGSASGAMTDGYLVLYGGFEQAGGTSSFRPAGSHSTLICGSGARAITFASPADSSFANLYVLNGAIGAAQAGGLPVTGDRVLTGTTLSGIAVDGGASALYPAFSAAKFAYETVVPEGTALVSVSPAKAYGNEAVTVRVGGAVQTGPIAVPANKTTTVTLGVLSAAGEPYAGAGAPFSAVYTLTLQPENTKLASPGFTYATDKPFQPDVTQYAVTVPVKDETLKLEPTLANPNASFRFLCGGREATGSSFSTPIQTGRTVTVDVVVTAYRNPAVPSPATRTYRFTFRRQTLLGGIAVSGGYAPNEPFADTTMNYTVDVAAASWAVTVTPTKGDGCAACRINGAAADSIVLRPGIGSSAKAEITLADSSGTYERTYTVTARRPALLSNITICSGAGGSIQTAPLPAFTSAVHAYAANVPVNAGEATVSGIKILPGCTGLTVGGQPDALTLAVAAGEYRDVELVASAGDAVEQRASYTVRVGKPLILTLGASAGSFTAPFDPNPETASAITLPYTQPSVRLTPTGNDRGTGEVTCRYTEGGTPLGAGETLDLTLAQGQTRTVTITAKYLDTEKAYTVSVFREKSDNANLRTLGAGNGWLSPAFAAATASYTLLLPEKVSSVKLAPVPADENATFRIDSQASGTPKTVSLALGGSAKVQVTVTALRGNTKTYTVTVRRVNIVASLSTSPIYKGYPSLSPGGTDRLTVSYGLSMPATVKLEVRKSYRWYTVFKRTESASGTRTFAWDGKVNGRYLGAGTYYVRVTPYWKGTAGTQRTFKVKILSHPAVYVTYLSPVTFRATGSSRLAMKVKWTRLCDVRVDIVNAAGRVVRTVYTAKNQAPATRTLYWNGKSASGALVPAGTYRVKVTCGGASPRYKSFTVKR